MLKYINEIFKTDYEKTFNFHRNKLLPILFYSILFYSILFYSILFYIPSILFTKL